MTEREHRVTVAWLACVFCGLAIGGLLTLVAQAHTPHWFWITDHCPNAELSCGSMAIGYLIPAVGAAVITTGLTWSGAVINEEGETDD